MVHEMKVETENIAAIAKMKMEGTHPRGRPRLTGKDTVFGSGTP